MSFEVALFFMSDVSVVGGILALAYPDQLTAINEAILPKWCIVPAMNRRRFIQASGALFVTLGLVLAGFLIARL